MRIFNAKFGPAAMLVLFVPVVASAMPPAVSPRWGEPPASPAARVQAPENAPLEKPTVGVKPATNPIQIPHPAQAQRLPIAPVRTTRAPAPLGGRPAPRAAARAEQPLAAAPANPPGPPRSTFPKPFFETVLAPVTTGVGNQYRVIVNWKGQDADGTSYTNVYQLRVSYADAAGYMKDTTQAPPATITGWMRVNTSYRSNGRVLPNGKDEVAITLDRQPDGTYLGTNPKDVTVTGGDGSRSVFLESVDLAFGGPQNKWDSNNGANYHYGLDSQL